jgi:uncharacterized protein
MPSFSPPDLESLRGLLHGLLHRLEHVLPAQAPIRDFVHHNTLHGFQHLPFRDALAAAEAAIGAHGYQPLSRFRAYFRQGRIDLDDLHAALDETPELPSSGAAAGPFERRAIVLAGLLADFTPPPGPTWAWQVEELGVLERLAPDLPAHARARLLDGAEEAQAVGDLWRVCAQLLAVRDAPVAAPAVSPPTASEVAGEAEELWHQHVLRKKAETRLAELLARMHQDLTLRGLLMQLTGRDVLDGIRPYLIRHLASHLDQGLTAWHNPERGRGFYAAWLASAREDRLFDLQGLENWEQTLERLPEEPLDAILQAMRTLGLDPAHWESYLESLAKELPGWSGMVLWREQHPGHAGVSPPVAMTDYLAVRLVLEQLHGQRLCGLHFKAEASLPGLRGYLRRHPAELLVRLALYDAELPEWLADQGHRLVRAATGRTREEQEADWLPVACLLEAWRRGERRDTAAEAGHADRHAWPLFLLCQHLGINAVALSALGAAGARKLLDCLAELTPERAAWVWLQAYERHYREQVFAALAAGHGQGAWRDRATAAAPPRAQLVFCMDDREEGLRRHLEECQPDVETLGAAAHLGLFIRYSDFGDAAPMDLCPVGARPAHAIEAVAADAADGQAFLARRARRLTWKARLIQGSRRDPAQGLLGSLSGAPVALVMLAGRMLAPAALGRWTRRLRDNLDGQVATQLRYMAVSDMPATPEAPRAGYSRAEQAERVSAFLTAISLTRGFSPLVVIVGHGSASLNNPHRSAYNCGACSGRHSGPNARLFAAMANRPEVRERMRARGIDIPDGTRFLGCEHNTCDDSFTWYDADALPASHTQAFAELDATMRRAGALHAQERCRRFLSAPLDLTPEQARRHVAGRRNDYSQARPELGHVNNASAFIGRRAATRGTFFDRRIFLISYDCDADPDGSVLEPMLVANGQVGAGISLEYYFSTVSNERYGSGSKITHNIAGLIGVMDGASSDLRTGLPSQMIEIHEAMRLLIVVEHSPEVLGAIYARQPVLQELVGNGWVQLAVKDPDSPAIRRFVPGRGWSRMAGRGRHTTPWSTVPRSGRAVGATPCRRHASRRRRRACS